MKHLLRIKDLTKKDFDTIVNSAMSCKAKIPSTIYTKGKHGVSFFSKSSSRTKSSWEVACFNLRMESSYNDAASSQLGHKESIKDSARVFSKYYDIMGWRCMKYEDIKEFSKYATMPCVNLLCNKNHPTQAIADIITIKAHFPDLKKVKLAFVGACNNNVARSLIEAILMSGGQYIGVGPKSEHPDAAELKEYKALATKYNGKVSFSTNASDVKGCNVIYQDVFLDLGESSDLWPSRLTKYTGYQVNSVLFNKASKDCIYMHCLPALNGSKNEYTQYVSKNFGKKFSWVKNGEVEVTNSVFESKNSVVFEQAQNRMFAMEAIIKFLIEANE